MNDACTLGLGTGFTMGRLEKGLFYYYAPGDKGSQQRDIKKAQKYWEDYKEE